MQRIDFGETYGRSAYVDENKDGVYVKFTDWNTRQAGSVDGITIDLAVRLAKMFTIGCPYTFDPTIGIVLEKDPNLDLENLP